MTILKRNKMPLKFPAGTRIASATVATRKFNAIAVHDGFLAAMHEFNAEFGEFPDRDRTQFIGAFTSDTIVFEILEVPDNKIYF